MTGFRVQNRPDSPARDFRSTRTHRTSACRAKVPTGDHGNTIVKKSRPLGRRSIFPHLVRKPNRWSSPPLPHSSMAFSIQHFPQRLAQLAIVANSFWGGGVTVCHWIFDSSVDSLGPCYAFRLLARSKIVVSLPPGLVVGNRGVLTNIVVTQIFLPGLVVTILPRTLENSNVQYHQCNTGHRVELFVSRGLH